MTWKLWVAIKLRRLARKLDHEPMRITATMIAEDDGTLTILDGVPLAEADDVYLTTRKAILDAGRDAPPLLSYPPVHAMCRAMKPEWP